MVSVSKVRSCAVNENSSQYTCCGQVKKCGCAAMCQVPFTVYLLWSGEEMWLCCCVRYLLQYTWCHQVEKCGCAAVCMAPFTVLQLSSGEEMWLCCCVSDTLVDGVGWLTTSPW